MRLSALRRETINLKDLDNAVPIGQKIMVYIDTGNFAGTYSSYIYDMDDNYIYILMPTNENGLKAVMREKDVIDVSFVEKKGGRVGFSSSIAGIGKKTDKVVYKLNKPTKMVRIELRDSFRVEVLISSEIYHFEGGKIKKSSGTIIDISAGGIKLSCDADLEVRDKLFLKFELDSYMLDQVEAEVVRKAITGEKDVKHYGLRFMNFDKNSQDKIIKFCLNRQLEMIRKAKGVE